MILYPDTVIDPGTVMVKAVNTAIADSAVTGTGSADDFAVRTDVGCMHLLVRDCDYLLEHVDHCELGVTLYYAWV